MREDDQRAVKLAFEVQVRLPERSGGLAAILEILRRRGASLQSLAVCGFPSQRFVFFLCDDPTEAAVALCDSGLDATTNTVIAVRIDDGAALFDHLVLTLEEAGLWVERGYSISRSTRLFAVFRTDDNPRAEDVLSNYLRRGDQASAGSPGTSSTSPLT